jgi:hypothetical protein
MSARFALACENCGADILVQQASVGGVTYPPFGYCVPCGYATVVHCFRVSGWSFVSPEIAVAPPSPDSITGAAVWATVAPLSLV